MIEKIRMKIMQKKLSEYLKDFFKELNFGDFKQIKIKMLDENNYLINLDSKVMEANLNEIKKGEYELCIKILEDNEQTEKIYFVIRVIGKFGMKYMINPMRYEVEKKTKKQVIDLKKRTFKIYLYRTRVERENNTVIEFEKIVMQSKVINLRKLLNVSKKRNKK